MRKTKFLMAAVAAMVLGFSSQAMASGGGAHLEHANVDVTDQAQIRRGLTVFTDVCMGCHSAKYVTYRGLMDYPEIGLTREQVDELRDDKSLMSGMISDLSIEDAIVSYGKAPPDLSLIVPGRRGGADYVYSLLTGYEHDHEGKVPDGNWNKVFPGNRIAMPDPLSWLDHEADETAELKQQAEDVAAFLAFIADPHQNTRREIGCWVMGFLLLLTLVLWRLKVEVWKDVKH
ncbi:MAG: cytochrome c1 [Mariprofundus sp.]